MSLREQARANRPAVDGGQPTAGSEPVIVDVGEDPEAVDVKVALSRVMRFCRALPKGSTATVTTKSGQYTYKYRGIDDVVSLAGTAMRLFGLIITPSAIETQHKVGNPSWCKVDVTYLVESLGGGTIIGRSTGEALDFGDKALVKALTQAYRVFLTTLLSLPTRDISLDSDANSVVRPQPPSPLELRDEMLSATVTTQRLRAILSMLQRDEDLARTKVPVPTAGPDGTHNERNEALWDLNVRIGKERKGRGDDDGDQPQSP